MFVMKIYQTAGQASRLRAGAGLGSVLRVLYFGMLILLSLEFSGCKKEDAPPPPDPCLSNRNEWGTRIKLSESDFIDLTTPIFLWGEQIDMELTLLPRPWNECPSLRSVEVKLIQTYASGAWESSDREVGTILNQVVNASDSVVLRKAIVPPPGTGDYFLVVTARDSLGNILIAEKSNYFHIQQIISPLKPVNVSILSPYYGQEVKKGTPLLYKFWFRYLGLGNIFKGSIELLDENGDLITTIRTVENVGNTGGSGNLDTSTPGKYTLRATALYFDPNTLQLFLNTSYNKFTIKN